MKSKIPLMPENKKNQKKSHQASIIYLIIIAFILSGVYVLSNQTPATTVTEINYSTFLSQANGQQIDSLSFTDDRINITLKDGKEEYTVKDPRATPYDLLNDIPLENRQNLNIDIIDSSQSDFWLNLFMQILPFLLIVGFLIFLMRHAQNSNNQALSFGQSKARIYDNNANKKTTFQDVAGSKEAKEELVEIVDFLKNPAKYTAIGAKIPKGVLLIGHPGTGKTLLARAVAGEANVPFFSISGSEFVEMFVGVGASRVRDLFKKAKRNAPCIIFIDEIDAVGRHRGAGLGGGHDEREQTLNQILTEMDGFEVNDNVIIMAATNRPDVLDPALLRPGRFDRRITVDLPTLEERKEILNVHARNKPLVKNIDLRVIARHTPGFSGADLENIMNEAAILAAKKGEKKIDQLDIEKSVEKVMMGPERKSKILSEKEKKITAYHEVGHALVAHNIPECDPVQKISIISRGMALGVTWFLPEEDYMLYSKSKFEGEICSLLGGYVAEQIMFKETTTGPSNDLERATKIAKNMVTKFAMSDIGLTIFGGGQQEVFLGRDYASHTKDYSEKSAEQIDYQVNVILESAYNKTKTILIKNKKKLCEIAEYLLKKETITREEFLNFFKTKEAIVA
ncbi:MAG: ATP-dependent metalloprotease FtsH, cell division protease FtsH [Candidatus Peregrinibacteria bacterium GW2011_GWF2_33_10]|nr:MAG: ATP-dependent metalloprotease FtsH, cell division protease FtsH [Candidatus Peregrinibacteria bacterium GW2011_GWF2_33_10]